MLCMIYAYSIRRTGKYQPNRNLLKQWANIWALTFLSKYPLTYIFDLYAIGQQVPINRIEGSFDAKKIKQDASKFPMYDKAPDTFYRAVKSVLEYDLNKPTDLQNISKDWLNAVRNLSTNWVITEQYLKDKNLIGE